MGCSDFDGDSHTRKADWFLNDSVVRCPVFPPQIPIYLPVLNNIAYSIGNSLSILIVRYISPQAGHLQSKSLFLAFLWRSSSCALPHLGPVIIRIFFAFILLFPRKIDPCIVSVGRNQVVKIVLGLRQSWGIGNDTDIHAVRETGFLKRR